MFIVFSVLWMPLRVILHVKYFLQTMIPKTEMDEMVMASWGNAITFSSGLPASAASYSDSITSLLG
jgi:hypothetical protein